MGVIYNKKTRKLVNPIDWSNIDKYLLAGVVIAPWYYIQAFFGYLIIQDPDLAPFINLHIQQQLNYYFILCGFFWILHALAAFLLRKTKEDNAVLRFVTMIMPVPMTIVIVLVNGALISSTLAGSAVVAMLGFFFFETKAMIRSVSFNMLLIAAAAILCAYDMVPYAQLYESVSDSGDTKVWMLAQFLITLYPATCGILMMMFFLKGLRDRESRIRELSRRDGLTGVWNHRYLMEIFERELLNTARQRNLLSFLMIDLDYFKKLNDQYGHKTGDKALEVAAQVLLKALRTTDYLGRYGGEEFAVVLPNCNVVSAREVAERCRKAIEDTIVEYNGFKVNITASIGVTTVTDANTVEPNDVIERADKALYHSKSKGRNCVSFYSEPV